MIKTPLIYPLPNSALNTSECPIWEGVYQGVLIADFRIYVPMHPTSIQIAVPKGIPPPHRRLGPTESSINGPRVINVLSYPG